MITGDGVLGQVFRTGPFSSEIILITDAEHALPVQVVRSGVRTIALGTGRSTSLELPYVPQNYDVKVGDLLVTSGLGQVFPFGLPVARVTKVERDPDAAAGADPCRAARRHRNRSRSAVHLGSAPIIRPPPRRPKHWRSKRRPAGEDAMNLARREPRWAVTFTVLLALIAQVLPLPDWLSVVRPSFVALVIIYWSIYAPHAGGIFAPWLAGLALDVFKGDVLAQNALAIALVAYIAMSLHQRLRNQTLVQQSLFVFAMLTLNEFVVWGIEGWSGHAVVHAVALDPADDRRHVVAVRRVAGRPHAHAQPEQYQPWARSASRITGASSGCSSAARWPPPSSSPRSRCVLVGRLVVLQVMRYDYYAELSQGNRVRVEPLPAQRGLILDRNGAVLAENRPAFQLELVRERVPDVDATLKRLIEIGVLPLDDLDETRKLVKSRRSFESVPIRLRLTDEEIARFAVHRFEFPGVDIATRLTRFYPHGEHAVHALGYVAAISESDVKKLEKEKQLTKYAGTSLIGKLGIEASYEKQLHGSDGSRQILVNAAGRSVQRQGHAHARTCRSIKPVAGPRRHHQHRPADAARRRAGTHRPARRGGRHRSEQRRRHRDGVHAGLRSESLRPRPHHAGIRARCATTSTCRCSIARSAASIRRARP